MKALRTERFRRELTRTRVGHDPATRRKQQAGFTLIELIIASAIGVLVLGSLTSVVLTTVLAANTANARIQASSQVRSFQFTAYDDIALARPPGATGCGTPATPCTRQDMILQGTRIPSLTGSLGTPGPYTVRYAWDSTSQVVTRYAGTSSRVVARDVTAYSWYVDIAPGAHPSVVVSMTVTVAAYDTIYSESQTFLFYPRITSSPAP
jgi:prepilin-type N-terminal cleavage/methylation domain-containing protein